MQLSNVPGIVIESSSLSSVFLNRDVIVDFYLPKNVPDPSHINLLLINDGQILEELGFETILERLYSEKKINPLLCVGIHAGEERKMEYGTAHCRDYKGRGAKAVLYTSFVFEELLPYTRKTYRVPEFKEKAFLGFSLGGLSALDIVWNHPHEFSRAGAFSASLWWRTKSLNDGYEEDSDRIMHQHIRNGQFHPWLRFFFQTGTLDEEMDRNKNGVIDSIDDTKDLINELIEKGYDPENNIHYLELENGTHDAATWSIAMPEFLEWGWGVGAGNHALGTG